ncbi:MAG: PDZ domain-containing protein, partial [Verrucomicrobiae bacterium]|nr:PDZ domain-containing protein [Verrucomicrobiae bacterium]
ALPGLSAFSAEGRPKPASGSEPPKAEEDASVAPRAPKPPRPNRPVDEATPRTEMRPWLGVATAPVDPAVREHLELPEGFGVSVEYVVEDSPAATAGLKAHDILIRLDDQRLTTPEHLSTLVRSMAKGNRIKLTVIRKGAEQTVEAVLGETEMPVQPEWPRTFGLHAQPVPGQPHQWKFEGEFPLPILPQAPGAANEDWQDRVREYQDRLREWIEKNQSGGTPQPPSAEKSRPHSPDGDRPPSKPEPAEHGSAKPALPLPAPSAQAEPKAQDKPPSISVRPGFPVQVFSGSGMIRIDNQQGEVTIQMKDGKHTIAIADADGKTVYQGDYDPDKGAEGLPKEAREQLKKMKLDDLKVLGLPQIQGSASEKNGEAPIQTEIKIEVRDEAAESKPAPKEKRDGLL